MTVLGRRIWTQQLVGCPTLRPSKLIAAEEEEGGGLSLVLTQNLQKTK